MNKVIALNNHRNQLFYKNLIKNLILLRHSQIGYHIIMLGLYQHKNIE